VAGEIGQRLSPLLLFQDEPRSLPQHIFASYDIEATLLRDMLHLHVSGQIHSLEF
jgi:hypothetical protein